MQHDADPIHGRGAGHNPANRFTALSYERPQDWDAPDDPAPQTQFFTDASRSITSRNDSPDVGFEVSINPYRGCEHGCIYCYARPTHEYLGFSAGLDFETKILVKHDAPRLLHKVLTAPTWKPCVVAISGVTDPYQPVERRLQLTRQCLEVLVIYRNPVIIITKNHLVTRDVDLLRELTRHQAAMVYLSVTTLNIDIGRALEPRASTPARRLDAIDTLSRAGVPVGVLVAPVIPGLTDHELPAIISAAAQAGARYAGYIFLRLPHGVGPLFEAWLRQHVPDKRAKILKRIREARGGRLNDARFGSRMRGEGMFAQQIAQLFALACRRAGMQGRGPTLSTASFRRPHDTQLSLFG